MEGGTASAISAGEAAARSDDEKSNIWTGGGAEDPAAPNADVSAAYAARAAEAAADDLPSSP